MLTSLLNLSCSLNKKTSKNKTKPNYNIELYSKRCRSRCLMQYQYICDVNAASCEPYSFSLNFFVCLTSNHYYKCSILVIGMKQLHEYGFSVRICVLSDNNRFELQQKILKIEIFALVDIGDEKTANAKCSEEN